MEFDIKIDDCLIEYKDSLNIMNERKAQILDEKSKSLFWILEHKSIYTGGRSAKKEDILNDDIDVVMVDRGGKYTYHGPGQRIGYIVANLKEFNNGVLDIRKFVNSIEYVIINTLLHYNIESFADRDSVGIWVNTNGTRKKIAAIGIKISQMVTTHGFALNVDPDLGSFNKIIPCGIREYGVCSIRSLKPEADLTSINDIMRGEFEKVFLRS